MERPIVINKMRIKKVAVLATETQVVFAIDNKLVPPEEWAILSKAALMGEANQYNIAITNGAFAVEHIKKIEAKETKPSKEPNVHAEKFYKGFFLHDTGAFQAYLMEWWETSEHSKDDIRWDSPQERKQAFKILVGITSLGDMELESFKAHAEKFTTWTRVNK